MTSRLGRLSARTRIAAILSVTVSLVASGCSLHAQSPPQYRAFWVDTFNTTLNNARDVAIVVGGARAAAANALFVQVRRRGDAWYVHAIEPPPDDVPIAPGFDPLQELLVQGHAAGLEIHAFVIVGALWNRPTAPLDPTHVFNRHGFNPLTGRMHQGADNWLTRTLVPDGAATSFDGYRIGNDFWMEPGHPDAAAYTLDVLMRLVRSYEIDGLHLDRIRYPEISIPGQRASTGVSIGYNEVNLARFRQRHRRAAGSMPEPNDPVWNEWRRDQVTSLVRRIYLNVVAAKPRLKVSAALIAFGSGPAGESDWPESEAYWRVFQDWSAWLAEGILDIAMPMNYKTEHTSTGQVAFDQWTAWTRTVRKGRLALIGIGAYLNSIEGTLRQTRRALASSGALGLDGVSFFSFANTNAAVPANPVAPLPGRDTPRRSFAEFASALRTGGGANAAERYEDPAAGTAVFAEVADVPPMPWKAAPQKGHLMGVVRDTSGAPIDSAFIEIRSVRRNLPVRTKTDGGGFYGAVDLTPGAYGIVISMPNGPTVVSRCSIEVDAGRVATLNLLVDARRPAFAGCEGADPRDLALTAPVKRLPLVVRPAMCAEAALRSTETACHGHPGLATAVLGARGDLLPSHLEPVSRARSGADGPTHAPRESRGKAWPLQSAVRHR